MDTTVKLRHITLKNPGMNAAGPLCKTIGHVRELSSCNISVIMVGSGTVPERERNPGRVYHYDGICSLNSLGLPNPGLSYYREHFPEMSAIARDAGQHLMFSGAGFSPEEDAQLVEAAAHGGATGIELNKGCPNVWLAGEQKRIMSFDPRSIEESLTLSTEVIGTRRFEFWLKLSPYSDPVLLREVADVIGGFEVVTGITVVNTFPNGFLYAPDGNSAINPEFSDGLAGMSGKWMKGVGLGHIKQLRKMQTQGILPERIKLIGVGGIWCGQDIVEYLRVGASAVQVGTAAFEHGLPKLSQILTEYLGCMELSEEAATMSA